MRSSTDALAGAAIAGLALTGIAAPAAVATAPAPATIADVPPGQYEIRARIGGGTPQPIATAVRLS
ncbi:hypothetical protein [Saccharopolyspora griseoalba]|uniref:Uncharacterized protein n=1 Tax=Saccharopolyspora griseoalba TaxID=1431848 RepID=A0ABW2LQ72_9PSEU